MSAEHILIIVSVAVMPVSEHRGNASYSYTATGATWPAVTTQRFDDRPSCEHAARQVKTLASARHDIRMTCQPAAQPTNKEPTP
jgi:outer membrane receptor for monomeric catechols